MVASLSNIHTPVKPAAANRIAAHPEPNQICTRRSPERKNLLFSMRQKFLSSENSGMGWRHRTRYQMLFANCISDVEQTQEALESKKRIRLRSTFLPRTHPAREKKLACTDFANSCLLLNYCFTERDARCQLIGSLLFTLLVFWEQSQFLWGTFLKLDILCSKVAI